MAIRTTADNVKAILVNHYDLSNSPDLTAFIATANVLTDQVDACDTNNSLDATELELIERYLAAHFYAHSDQIAQSKTTGDASTSFQGTTGKGLDSTQYGQTAMLLDETGCLTRKNTQMIEGKKRATVTWMGKAKSAQTNYVDRD
jgi:hypothetical protein